MHSRAQTNAAVAALAIIIATTALLLAPATALAQEDDRGNQAAATLDAEDAPGDMEANATNRTIGDGSPSQGSTGGADATNSAEPPAPGADPDACAASAAEDGESQQGDGAANAGNPIDLPPDSGDSPTSAGGDAAPDVNPPARQDGGSTATLADTPPASGDDDACSEGFNGALPPHTDGTSNPAASNGAARASEATAPATSTPTASAHAAQNGKADELSGEDAMEMVSKLIAAAVTMNPEEAASAVVEWATKALLGEIFNTPMDQDAALKEILKELEILTKGLEELQRTANSQQLDNILNDVKPLITHQTSNDVYNALKGIDDDLAKGKITEDDAKQERLSVLTSTLGIDESHLSSVENSYDTYAEKLATALTTTYHVTMNGKTQDLMLLQIEYEHLRNKYHWENQAYDEWSAFQARTLGLLMATLTIEKSSLQARIALIPEWNAKHPNETPQSPRGCVERLKDVQKSINLVKDMYGAEAWENGYWLYKQRDDGERYYWTPGHEILFYSQVNTQSTPKEDEHCGSSDPNAKGIVYHKKGANAPRFSFWKPFIRYHGGNQLLVSYDQLKTIYADYNAGGATKSLYEIFMSEQEGNFRGLSGDFDNWQFVIDPDSKHALGYDWQAFAADRLYCWQVDGMAKSTSLPNATRLILCYYHYWSSENNCNTNYIGIGVKRVGALPGMSQVATANTFTRNDDEALWTPAEVRSSLVVYAGAHGDLMRLTMDGKPVSASDYTASPQGLVELSGKYLAKLDAGHHQLVMTTKAGTHVVDFITDAYYMARGNASTWSQGSASPLTFVAKRLVLDNLTFSRLLGVLVDGVAVPADGYDAWAGSAVISLKPSYLATLSAGPHLLTVLFSDGNTVEASFAVNDQPAGMPTTTASYDVASAQVKATPATGDTLSVAALAVLALFSGVTAFSVAMRGKLDKCQNPAQ